VLRTPLLRPAAARDLPGATPTGLALSPDEQTLYITLGDMNAVAVIDAAKYRLKGYIPVGWYPTAVVVSPDNKRLLVANGNGTQTRYPNPLFDPFHPDADALEVASPYFVYNVMEGNVSTIPLPTSASALANYSREVLANSRLLSRPGFTTRNPLAGIGVRTGIIQHVIYIVKENRSYDQILGDLPQGNGDPSLAIFGREVTPNQHALAERFVLLDNFYNNGAVSGEGWIWLTQGYANEFVERNIPYLYRIPTPPGPSPTNDIFDLNYDYEGQNNGYPTGGFPAKDVDGKQLSRLFPNGLPPIPNITEGPGGHIWDLVKHARLTYRNYGFFVSIGDGTGVIPDNYPSAVNLQPEGHDLAGVTDYDFRRFDLDYADSDAGHLYFQQTGDPDYVPFVPAYGKYNMPSRFSEWNREFQQMLARDPKGRGVPQFMTLRFLRDHSQGLAPSVFSPAEKRHIIHAPRAMVADNDYAVGQFVETISKSPIWKSTAIFIIEDDAQSGPDHVDAHRSPCFVVSPWIKKSSVDHTFYTTGSVLKSIELLLGLPSMTQYDAVANPIIGWEKRPSNDAPYTAILPPKEIMRETNPALASLARNDPRRRLAVLSQKMNFRTPDSAPALLLNEILWKSVRGPNAKPPAPRFSTIAALKARGRNVSQPRDVDD
jgi:YVTN family beta-propeller protein